MFGGLHYWVAPAALGALSGGAIQQVLQRRRHRSTRLLKKRTESYIAYLETLEAISRAGRLDLQTQVLGAMSGRLAGIFSAPAAADPTLVEMTTDFSRLLAQMSFALAKANDGLPRLKLVGSQQVLGLLEEYIALRRRLYTDAVDIIAMWSRGSTGAAPPAPLHEMAARAERSEELLHRIITQMRQELGIDPDPG